MSSLPNVAAAVAAWEIAVKLKTVTPVTSNFVRADTVNVVNRNMVVQPQDPARLKADNIDISLRHMRFHCRTLIVVGQIVEWQSTDYKIIMASDWRLYGYCEGVGVETRRALLVAT